MSIIRETAYPRLKRDFTERELAEIYNPSIEEVDFVFQHVHRSIDRLALLLLIKTGQRLGYFISVLSEIPKEILTHIRTCAKLEGHIGKKELRRIDQTRSLYRLRDVARDYLGLNAFKEDGERLVFQVAEKAAQTKQELADIINVIVEELARQRFELPAFSVFLRAASHARSTFNNRLYGSIHAALSSERQLELDALLEVDDNVVTSDWQKIKKEPKKPTNKEIRRYLSHLTWLRSWVDRLPKVNAIPAAKWRQLVLEARALDVAELKKTKPSKRYTLIIVLIHSQLRSAMDDAVSILIRKMSSLHNKANQRLQDHHLDRRSRVESLVSQFRDVLRAYRDGESDAEKILGIQSAFQEDPELLLEACDEQMAYAGNNYIPFMLPSYDSSGEPLQSTYRILYLYNFRPAIARVSETLSAEKTL
ncbi:MAG: hypothetical protein ACI9YB_001518 [Halioglobus sp.]|jgi:hypothetical protein